MRNSLKISALIMTLFIASDAFAVFDAQLLIGQRSGEVGDTDSKAQEITVAAHVDPIPMVPLALGLYATKATFKDDLDHVEGLEAGLQLYGWFPIGIAGFKPYAKLGIPLYSAFKSEIEAGGEKVEELSETSGMHINFGIGYSPIPLVGLLFEVGLGQQKLKTTELKVGGEKQEIVDAESDYKTTAFMFGVEVGL